jgi:hypothetical protein
MMNVEHSYENNAFLISAIPEKKASKIVIPRKVLSFRAYIRELQKMNLERLEMEKETVRWNTIFSDNRKLQIFLDRVEFPLLGIETWCEKNKKMR